MNRCNGEYCMMVLADVYRIFYNNNHYKLCLGNAACSIMTMANGTYYIFNQHICDVMRFQNDKEAAVMLYLQAQERLLTYHTC